MTAQEKLDHLKTLLAEYADNEAAFDEPAEETARQKQCREDLHLVVSLVFHDTLPLSSNLSVSEIRDRLRGIWDRTKPDEWK